MTTKQEICTTWLATLVFSCALLAAASLLNGCDVYEEDALTTLLHRDGGDDEEDAGLTAQALTTCHSDSSDHQVAPGQRAEDAALNMRLSGLSTGWKWQGWFGFPEMGPGVQAARYRSGNGLIEYQAIMLQRDEDDMTLGRMYKRTKTSTGWGGWRPEYFYRGWFTVRNTTNVYAYGFDWRSLIDAQAQLSPGDATIPIYWKYCQFR